MAVAPFEDAREIVLCAELSWSGKKRLQNKSLTARFYNRKMSVVPTWSGLSPGGTHVYSSRAQPESSSLWLCRARSVCPPAPTAPLTSLPIPSSFTSPDIASDSAASTFLKSKCEISCCEVICDLSGDRARGEGGAGDWVRRNRVEQQ